MESATNTLLNDEADLDVSETVKCVGDEESMDVDQENNINVINQLNDEKNNTIDGDDRLTEKTEQQKSITVFSNKTVKTFDKNIEKNNITEIISDDSNSCESFIKRTLNNFSSKNFEDDVEKGLSSDSDEDSRSTSSIIHKNSNLTSRDEIVSENSNLDKNDENEVKRTRKRITILDSDEESNSNVCVISEEMTSNENEVEKDESIMKTDETKKRNRIKLYDSDSDDEITTIEKKQSNSDEEIFKGENNTKDSDVNSIVFSSAIKSKLSTLCDSESSEDEELKVRRHNFDEDLESNKPMLNYKKSKLREEKPKQMTGKDAVKLRREIQSESQRMEREQKICLPYHKPRSYTLKEFLEKRAKLSSITAFTKSKPTHFNMKMTPQQIEEMARTLERREKELDEFYKNESEDEVDVKDDKAKTNGKIETNIEEENKDTTAGKEGTNQVEELHSVKELEKDGDIDHSRKKHDEQSDTLNNKDSNIENTNCPDDNKNNDNIAENKPAEQEKPKTNKILERLKKMNPLLAKADFKPCLTGNSSDVIILDEDVEKTRAIKELKKRYIAQISMKPTLSRDEVHIMSIDKNILKHEAAKVLVNHDDEPRGIELKPGEKRKKLKHQLELLMAKKRWEQYEKTKKEIEAKNLADKACEVEKEECGVLDDEEEEELTDSETSDSEEEEEMDIVEKPRQKSDFVDDEAEESDLDDSDDEGNQEEINDLNNDTKKKEMKRIIKPFTEDDSEDETNKENETQASLNSTQSIQNDMFEDNNILTSDDDEIPLYQKENPNKTPSRGVMESKSEFNLTPTVCLTALQGMPSTSKRTLHESPGISLSLPLPQEPSPLRLNPGVKTKLFEFNDGDINNLNTFEELEDLCSGKFSSAVNSIRNLNTQDENELLGLCSGKFDLNVPDGNHEKKNNTSDIELSLQENELLGVTSGSFNVNIPKSADVEKEFYVNISGYNSQVKENVDKEISEISKNINFELENLSNDSFLEPNKIADGDQLNMEFDDNSQDMKLTFEEDDPIFKQNDDTSGKESSDKNENLFKKDNTIRKLVILSSDEEVDNNELETNKKKKLKRKRKGLEFSDEEESDVESITMEENELDVPTGEVNYDSEENEIEYDENEEVVVKNANNFFEAEAELSESEWGSADEDERGLDILEEEDGDAEHFNEGKLQKELGKIHMRQVLDQDNREVKLIQELLLEDGELHGEKRERKFRWKNAESMTWNDDQPKEDENEEVEEVENELEWRKMRHEREVFLEEQRKKLMKSGNEIELLTSDSQILKIGHELLKKSQELNHDSSPSVVPPKIESFSFLNKRGFRGSFLARSENTLSRLAEMTKVTEKEFFMSSGPRNSRNFVFTSISKSEEHTEDDEDNEKKRKASEGTPTVLKKMRISENSPAGGKSNKKSKKSLFKSS